MGRLTGLIITTLLVAAHFGTVPAPVERTYSDAARQVHEWQAGQSTAIACNIRIRQGAETCQGQ